MPDFFNGRVLISFDVIRETRQFIIHILELELEAPSLVIESVEPSLDLNFIPQRNLVWTYDNITHQMTINLPNNQVFRPTFKYRFTANYKGFSKDNNEGFYRTSYLDNGVRK